MSINLYKKGTFGERKRNIETVLGYYTLVTFYPQQRLREKYRERETERGKRERDQNIIIKDKTNSVTKKWDGTKKCDLR